MIYFLKSKGDTTMTMEKIKKDHQRKSNQVKRLQRKLKNKEKNSINKNELLLKLEKQLYDLQNKSLDLYDDRYLSQELFKNSGREAELESVINLIKYSY
jgi:hypothetical protein